MLFLYIYLTILETLVYFCIVCYNKGMTELLWFKYNMKQCTCTLLDVDKYSMFRYGFRD